MLIRPSKDGSSLLGWLVTAMVLVNVFVMTMVVLSVHRSRTQAHDHAMVTAGNIAKILEQTISGLIAKTDLGLLAIADEITRQRRNGAVEEKQVSDFILQQDQRTRDVLGFRVFGRDGQLLYAVHGVQNPNANISDRGYFQRLQAGGQIGLVLSPPQIGRISGQWLITLARGIQGPDGAFDGVVTASIGIDHLIEILAALDLGSHAIVAMYNGDPYPVMAVRYPKDALGRSLIGTSALSSELAAFIASGQDSRQYDYVSPFDGLARIGSARKISRYPLYLVVGLAEADFFADWQKEARTAIGLAVAFLVVSLLLSYQARRGWHQRLATLARLEDSNARLSREERSLGDAQRIARLGSLEIDLVEGGVTCSHQARRILGDEPRGFDEPLNGFVAAVHPDDRDWVRKALLAALDDGHAREFECRIIRPGSDEVRWLSCCWQSERNEAGTPVRAIATIQDITERKRSEQEISRYRDHLETLVAERTAALTESNRQLEEEKERAEAANSAKSVFLSNMSHEIRTPMNAILGFTQILQHSTALAPLDRENLEVIHRSGRNLLALINDVLEMSKIEAGRATYSPKTFNLHDLLGDIYAMFDIPTSTKGLTLTLTKSATLPRYVVTDAGKLHQILINLLGNAMKFTETGGIELHAWSDIGTGGRHTLGIEVEDTGPGIAAEDQAHLFEPFRQAAGGLDKGGSGLGLAISRRFALLLGGDIHIKSTLGVGTRFRLVVPVAEGTPANLPATLPSRRVLGLAPGQKDVRILIVDDQPVNRLFVRRLLEPLGFTLRDAVNGEEAVSAWQTWQPDLILLDIVMPVMDGHEATRHIREHGADGKRVKIVALSASAFEEDRTAVMASGADAFLHKPVTEEQLLATIEAQLGIVYAEVTATPPPPPSTDPVVVSAEAVQALPPDLLERMRRAAFRTDDQELAALIESLPSHQSGLGRALAHHVARFDWDAVEASLLMDSSPGAAGSPVP